MFKFKLGGDCATNEGGLDSLKDAAVVVSRVVEEPDFVGSNWLDSLLMVLLTTGLLLN